MRTKKWSQIRKSINKYLSMSKKMTQKFRKYFEKMSKKSQKVTPQKNVIFALNVSKTPPLTKWAFR